MTENSNESMRELNGDELKKVGGGWIYVRPGTKPPRFPAPKPNKWGLPVVY